MNKQWLIGFWNAYEECAERGKADSPGGAEFHRVLAAALDLYPQPLNPKDFTIFIERGEAQSHRQGDTRQPREAMFRPVIPSNLVG